MAKDGVCLTVNGRSEINFNETGAGAAMSQDCVLLGAGCASDKSALTRFGDKRSP